METDLDYAQDFVTVQEAADIVQLRTHWPIRLAIRRGELKAMRIKGRGIRITRNALKKWDAKRKKVVQMEGNQEYMTIDEIADVLRLKTRWAVREAIRRRELPHIRVLHRRILVPRAAFVKWLEDKRPNYSLQYK
jgi:excisionase family DNA binding protein